MNYMKGVYLVHISDRMVLTEVCVFDFPKDIYQGQLLEAHDKGVILGGLHLRSAHDFLYDVPWEEILVDLNSRK